MTPVAFPEHTTTWAADGQPDETGEPRYRPLPAYSDDRQTITCWRLTWFERLTVLVTGELWLRQLNFGKALQPQLPSTESPFVRS